MTTPLRLLSMAAAFALTAGSGTAAAQTLYVRQVPAGTNVELLVNTTAAGSAQPDANGDARIPFNLLTLTKKNEFDARVYVDTCDALRRVTIAELDAAPLPPQDGCTRQELTGVFLVRTVSSVVVHVGSPVATLLLRQGSFDLRPRAPRRPAPSGFVVFGGGLRAKYTDAFELACANVASCSGDDAGFGYTAGAEYWFTPWLAAEGSYIRPNTFAVDGSSQSFRFNSEFEPHLFTIAGKVGIPAGPVRFYGRAGFNYHRAESRTDQHTDEIEVTDETGAVTVIPANDATVEAKTQGWGWLAGAGLEAWVRGRFALYGEAGLLSIKGDSEVADQGQINDRLMSVTVGIRIKLGQ